MCHTRLEVRPHTRAPQRAPNRRRETGLRLPCARAFERADAHARPAARLVRIRPNGVDRVGGRDTCELMSKRRPHRMQQLLVRRRALAERACFRLPIGRRRSIFFGDALRPQETPHTISTPGLPAHQLTLKKGLPLMLLRNLSPVEGLARLHLLRGPLSGPGACIAMA